MEQWALITGASVGIGRELAQIFAEHGFNLVLVARDAQRLNRLSEELKSARQIQTQVLAQDLSDPEAPTRVFEQVRGKEISVLVNNAGFGAYGPFLETDLSVQTDMMQVNMTALVELTQLFARSMVERRQGRILNVASTAAFQPGPLLSIYYASKAFVYSFTYALADELAGTGVTATALCPGMTKTEFQERAHLAGNGRWPLMSARSVAEKGYVGLMKGKRVVIPGLMNQVSSFIAKRAPARLTTLVVRRIHKPHN
jgi:short-subunit dehydrogenase